MKPWCGLAAAPSGLPWPLSAEAVDFASGASRPLLMPQPDASAARAQANDNRAMGFSIERPNILNQDFLLAGLGPQFQACQPPLRHFEDVLWRSSPMAGAAFHRILNG